MFIMLVLRNHFQDTALRKVIKQKRTHRHIFLSDDLLMSKKEKELEINDRKLLVTRQYLNLRYVTEETREITE